MQEWVSASVNKSYAEAVLVPDIEGKSPTAMITALYHRRKWEMQGCKASQIMFLAASADTAGGVWASRLLSEMTLLLQGIGAETVFLTTQAPNRIVIKAAEHFGFRFGEASLIFRRILT